MAAGAWLMLFVTVQRLAELVHAARNTRRLLAKGGVEVGRRHYPWLVLFHASWLGAMWWLGWQAPVHPWWLAVFVFLQVARCWVLWTLGPRWTTRIVVVDAPLVRDGPYRFLRHPNYAVVVGELAVVPLALHAPLWALGFSLAHLPLLWVRIRAEEAALAPSDVGTGR